MTDTWTPLLPLAMLGTDRQPSALPAWPGEVGVLAAQVVGQAGNAEGDVATRVLRLAAVLATCGMAGAQGAAWPGPVPEGALPDPLPTLPEGPMLALLAWALHHGPRQLQHEVFLSLARAKYQLPHALLPQALELGRRSVALRPLLPPALGERGVWLAAQRDEWRYAAGVSAEAPDEKRWSDGSIEQRRHFLHHERHTNPQAARERLTAVLDELPAKERAELATVLAERLSADR